MLNNFTLPRGPADPPQAISFFFFVKIYKKKKVFSPGSKKVSRWCRWDTQPLPRSAYPFWIAGCPTPTDSRVQNLFFNEVHLLEGSSPSALRSSQQVEFFNEVHLLAATQASDTTHGTPKKST